MSGLIEEVWAVSGIFGLLVLAAVFILGIYLKKASNKSSEKTSALVFEEKKQAYIYIICIYIYINYGFPSGLSGKESACRKHRRGGFDPWVGRSPGGENGNPLQYFQL